MIQEGQIVWMMLGPNFHGVRPIMAEVVRIGHKYAYIKPVNDGVYKQAIKICKDTFASPLFCGIVHWTVYLTEEACVAEFNRYKPYRDARDAFYSVVQANNITADALELCKKIIDVVNQHKEKK